MAGALVENLLLFGGVLRRGGLGVHPGRMQDVVAALERVGLERRDDVRAALRALLVHRREELAFFDAAFDAFWRARGTAGSGLPLMSLGERPRVVSAPAPDTRVELGGSEAPAARRSARSLAVAAWSAAESLRTRDFADLTGAELAEAEALLVNIAWRLGVRRTRRWTPAATGRLDLRAALRASMRFGGEPLALPRRARREKPRPIVVLADVSGSMARYARMVLQLAHGMTARGRTAESFVFATRLTRITREVARRGGGRALASVTRHVPDWGGGTRIGDALRAFNVHWTRRVMRHGPVVIVVSDGWDRGDPQMLARELGHVRRSCRRLVWLNPLLGSTNYEPLTRGMRAALPLVDDFMPAHDLASLEQLAAHLESLGADRRRRRRNTDG